jgi:hypothetical protein
MMNRPETSTAAIPAMDSGRVSLGRGSFGFAVFLKWSDKGLPEVRNPEGRVYQEQAISS